MKISRLETTRSNPMTPTETEKMLLDKILAIEPETHVTYYPTFHPPGWKVHKREQSLSKIYGYKINALIEALKNLQGEALI